MSTETFESEAKKWLAEAKDPRWKKPYTELTYLPMQEVLKYLRANGYKTYIVTGGGQDFVRVYSEATYGIPPEQVVGTAGGTKYGYAKDGKPFLTKEPKLLLNDNNAGKPEGIHLVIGRRPHAAFGNSTGDRQMLEYTKAGDGARLAMLVLHDDAKREYAYGPAKGLPDEQGRHIYAIALRPGEEAGLDRHQHEGRLEVNLPLRVTREHLRRSIGRMSTIPKEFQSENENADSALAAGAAVALGLSSPALAQAPAKKPNILFIVSDDTGYGDLGPYGGGEGRGMPTPSIDRMAADGMTFFSFYAQPSCTPGRAAMQTGRIPNRSGMTTVAFQGQGGGLPAAEWTLASVLKQGGYQTYFTGKWHLGEADYALPNAQGYDEMKYVGLYHLNAYTYGDPTWFPDMDPELRAFFNKVTKGALSGKAGQTAGRGLQDQRAVRRRPRQERHAARRITPMASSASRSSTATSRRRRWNSWTRRPSRPTSPSSSTSTS